MAHRIHYSDFKTRHPNNTARRIEGSHAALERVVSHRAAQENVFTQRVRHSRVGEAMERRVVVAQAPAVVPQAPIVEVHATPLPRFAPAEVAPVQVAPVQAAPVQAAPVQIAPVQISEHPAPQTFSWLGLLSSNTWGSWYVYGRMAVVAVAASCVQKIFDGLEWLGLYTPAIGADPGV